MKVKLCKVVDVCMVCVCVCVGGGGGEASLRPQQNKHRKILRLCVTKSSLTLDA